MLFRSDRGGNSLKLIGLHARLCRTFDVDLPVQRLFEISTVRAMARYLRAPVPGAVTGEPRAEERGVEERGAARRRRLENRKNPR